MSDQIPQLPRLPWTQDYYLLFEKVKTYVLRIETPSGYGTGFLVYRNPGMLAVATAYHVIKDSYEWGFPIKLKDEIYKQTVILAADSTDRFIDVHPQHDLAIICFRSGLMPNAPETMLELMDKGYYRKHACEVGWCGYPIIPPPGETLCFFAGWVSAFKEETHTYFIDGTVINGVSGGPCFFRGATDNPVLVGVVTAYYPSYSMGQALQGMGVVQAVEPFHGSIQSLEDSWNSFIRKQEEQKKVEGSPPNQD